MTGDVSRVQDVDRLYKEIAARKDKNDILFANAGIVEMTTSVAWHKGMPMYGTIGKRD